MKTREQVQRAHDILEAFINESVPVIIPERELELLRATCATMCWVLSDKYGPHPPGERIADLIVALEVLANSRGYAFDALRKHESESHSE